MRAALIERETRIMPTMKQVSDIYDAELTARSPKKMAKAGDGWADQKQGFYFTEEDVVDQCALAVLRQALELDGKTATPSARKTVQDLIDRSTLTDDAIKTVFLTCYVPKSKK